MTTKPNKQRSLKVFGGMTMLSGKQVRVCVATTGQKRAAEICGTNASYVRAFWSLTRNELEVGVATAHPHTMMVATVSWPTEASQYRPHQKKEG